MTHEAPDLDAVAAVWVLKRFDKERCGEAGVEFVAAGDSLSVEVMRERGLKDSEVVHVDTGMGEFDHHTEELAQKRVCAASLVYDYMVNKFSDMIHDDALARMVEIFVEIDHFGEVDWPEPNDDRYMFFLDEVLHHLKTVGESDEGVVEFGIKALDSVHAAFSVKVSAEEEVKKGREFETKWGKGLAMETSNDEVIKYGQKSGYAIVVRKDPELGNVRIKAVPEKNIDLTQVYERILVRDQGATWYFHPAKTMLLNGSRKKRDQVPSSLALAEVVEIISSVN